MPVEPKQSLEWIDQSGDGHVPKNDVSRRKIRQQAMRSTGTERRLKGNYGKVNTRQQPVFVGTAAENLPSPTQSSSSLPLSRMKKSPKGLGLVEVNQSIETYQIPSAYNQAQVSIPTSLSSTGYELARIKYGVDIPQLSTLTKVHFGRATFRILARKPEMVSDLFWCDELSYLSHVPRLYDRSSLIQDVTRCTLARTRQSLSFDPITPSATVLGLYGKALTSLQQALDNPARLRDPEVLCATQILALFELLNFSENGAWMRHVAGAKRLIELRGTDGYNSEFEKALFMAQAGPLFSESFLNNEACFVEKPEWQEVFSSMAVDGPVYCDRSQLNVSLWMIKYRVPGLLQRTTALVCSEGLPEANAVACLLREARKLHEKVEEWRYAYDCLAETYRNCSIALSNTTKARTVLAVCVTDLLLMTRCVLALDPVGSWELEDQAQALARLLVAIEQEVCALDVMATLFMAQKLGLAQSVIATEDDWRRARWQKSEELGGRTVIERWVFEKWCSMMGRKTS